MRLASGSKLGAWEVKELLGKGGQAKVYRGLKLSVDQKIQEAAIKTIVVDDKSQNFEVELLVQEHDLLASVDSPYTPQEIDSGVESFEEDAGKKRVYWFAMELVSGQHLYEEVQQNGPLDHLDWLNLAHDLLMALTEIHKKGIVHSDIKPANVVRNSRKSVLVDFGGSTIAGVQTIGDFGASTLRYSAPEKIQDPQNKDVLGYEVDIFSLGQVLVFAATGHAAWDANHAYTAVASGPDQEAAAVKLTRESYLKEIKTREPRISSMNHSQRKIVSKMLQLDPALRPDAHYLLQQIKDLLPVTSSRKDMKPGGKPMRWIPQIRNIEPGTVFQQGLYSILGWAVTLTLAYFTFTVGFLARYVMLSDQKLYLQSSRRTEYRFITAGSVFSSFGLMGLYFGKQYAELTGRAFYRILGWLGPVIFALSTITVYLSMNHADSWFYLPVLYASFISLLAYSLSWGALPKEKLTGEVY